MVFDGFLLGFFASDFQNGIDLIFFYFISIEQWLAEQGAVLGSEV